jgi:hypothetical protein
MKTSTFTLIIVLMLLPMMQLFSQGILVNHQSTNLDSVPVSWIEQAKSEFRIWYGHTSHGSQVTSGISNLQSNIGEPYTYSSSGSGGALSYQETGGDLGHNGDLTWYNNTRAKLDEPGNDRNVVMWSWCGGVSDNTEEGIDAYLNAMNTLETDYPDVTFIYMTGHLDIWSWANLKARNQQIRDYCITNNKILFDFADIESYNPDYTFFEYATDNCNYYDGPGGSYEGNWADEWCAANPGSDLCWDCYCAHSKSLNCNLKGRAFWWMMAEMAGWEPGQIVNPTVQNCELTTGWNSLSSFVIPEAEYFEEILAEILPAVLILQNQNGVFWPGQNVNTLGNWESNRGYLIKLAEDASLSISGSPVQSPSVDLYEGWNLIPVLCPNGMTIEELDLQLGDNLVFIQEAAGNAIYWPDMNIQTIDLLEPGKAYLVLVSVDTTLDFSTCGY